MDATTIEIQGAAAFGRTVRDAIARCEANVSALTAGPARSFRDTIEALDGLLEPLNGLTGRVHLYTNVHPDQQMRDVCEELEQEIARLQTSIGLNRALYERLVAVEAPADASPEERRLQEHSLRDFRRSGIDRDEATREKIRALQEELVEIGQTFDRNIITGGRELVVAEGHAALTGLPRDFLDSHPERNDGSVRLTTDPTDRFPVMTYAENEDLRRRYAHEFNNRACPENLDVLPRLLAKRHELAQLLGYPTWADYVTEDKMTKTAAEARAFLERVVELVRARALAEHEEFGELKRTTGSTEPVREYDRLFLIELGRKQRCAFDSQQVRPYFAYDRVRDGVLATTAALYGVTFERNPEVEVWHTSVECYDVVDGGETIARFYLDMHPREHKFKHAAMFDLSVAGEGVLPEAALECNFPEPTEDDPALLLHDQVTTFFHEFGHLLHHLFAGRQRFRSFAGIATEWDFVEVPSQMYEEWAWSPAVLATFATHHETGAPIPEELVLRMRAAEAYGRATQVHGQMFFALLSMTYYDRDPAGLDPTETMISLKRELMPVPHEAGSNFHASFGHLNGYSALYYTYMWSLVIAKDLWSAFEADPMEGATANRYRAEVLAPGGSRDAAELVRSFLGRDYSFEAFESWLAGS